MKRSSLSILLFALGIILLAGCSLSTILDENRQAPDFTGNDIRTKGVEDVYYYYYYDDIIFLQEKNDLLFLQFINNSSRERFLSESEALTSLKIWDPTGRGTNVNDNSFNILVVQSTNGRIPNEKLKEIRTLPDIVSASYLFEYKGNLIATSNEFSVKLKNAADYGKLMELANAYECVVEKRGGVGNNVYFVCLRKDSKYETIKLAASFYETGWFAFTSPCFYDFDGFTTIDTYYSDQWGLKNTGQNGGSSGIDINIESAWSVTEGSSNIVVAVLDEGVELSHPDLSANLVTGYDAILDVAGGGPVGGDRHGTAVAGIIGAVKDNGIGIRGVAPGCKIVPVRVGSNSIISYSAAAAAFDWSRLQGVDVINCSWKKDVPCALLTDAINNATSLGRGGKGCVVVFSSGNDSSNNSICYPAYLDNVIAVGAVNNSGQRSSFSNSSSSLDVVAPGEGVSTTDRLGNDGFNPPQPGNPTDYNDTDYTSNFIGTSAAAPHVSGIAALILSEYSNLTQSQVRRAIELGCTKLPGYSFTSDGQYPAGSKSLQVGHGLANAYNSLLQAAFINQTIITDGISGFDFTVTNNSSYDVLALFVGLTGEIASMSETLIYQDPGDVASGMQVGYPLYRGENLSATPGATISNIWLEFYGVTPNYNGNLRIGVAIDNPTPSTYSSFAFGDGDSFWLNLPNSSVPNASRRRVYIDIQNPQ